MDVNNTPALIEFTNFDPGPLPNSYDLSDHLPNGLISLEHLELDVMNPGDNGDWANAWIPVGSLPFEVFWDAVYMIATVPLGTNGFTSEMVPGVRFRRNTPKELWRDPEAIGYRVSAVSLDSNANQGLFVAVESAARAGVDPYKVQLDERRSTIPLVQLSQNHYGPGTDFTQKVWPFNFAGGYLDRAHVHAQARVAGVWQLLDIADEDAGTANPFRFIDDYTLHLDLSTLGIVTDLIIFRHTPRDVRVPIPVGRIDADELRDGAAYGYFAAMELGEAASLEQFAPKSFSVRKGDVGAVTAGFQSSGFNLATITDTGSVTASLRAIDSEFAYDPDAVVVREYSMATAELVETGTDAYPPDPPNYRSLTVVSVNGTPAWPWSETIKIDGDISAVLVEVGVQPVTPG